MSRSSTTWRNDIGETPEPAAAQPDAPHARHAAGIDGIRARWLRAEDGYDLWLRYARVEDATLRAAYERALTTLVAGADSPTERIVVAELTRARAGLLGSPFTRADAVATAGTLVVGTPARSAIVRALGWDTRLEALGPEGFAIRSTTIAGRPTTVIASAGEIGTLYGAFHFLRLIQTGRPIAALDIAERPRLARRLLNHWDNLDGSIERGYAGRSLWNWGELPDRVDPRVVDYARANASLGLNGTVVNSVNANPKSLSADYLKKAAALADTFRPVRHPPLSGRQFRRAQDAGRAANHRSPRSRRGPLVAREGRRDLRAHPGLRRLRRQGQQRGPAGPAGLQAHRTPTAPTCWPTRCGRTAAS